MKLKTRIHAYNELPVVMGILNVTPDSFSDGGYFCHETAIKKQVEKMQSAGVELIDIGGESTRPGAATVSLQEELDRVMPAIEWVKEVSDLAISIDTYKTGVMQQALSAGVDMINDVNALQEEGAFELVVKQQPLVCLMHKQGKPKTMQQNPSYIDVLGEVDDFLRNRAQNCIDKGLPKENILLDPGFGFGKTLEHNVKLFEYLEEIAGNDFPLLVGVSRKSMIGDLTGEAVVANRVAGSVSAAVVAMLKGARVIRVHDVKETMDALKVAYALI